MDEIMSLTKSQRLKFCCRHKSDRGEINWYFFPNHILKFLRSPTRTTMVHPCHPCNEESMHHFQAIFFFWLSSKCTFGLFCRLMLLNRLWRFILFRSIILKYHRTFGQVARSYSISVIRGRLNYNRILTGINWGWVEDKEVWCLPLWLFFFLLHVKDWLKHLLQVGIRSEYGL